MGEDITAHPIKKMLTPVPVIQKIGYQEDIYGYMRLVSTYSGKGGRMMWTF